MVREDEDCPYGKIFDLGPVMLRAFIDSLHCEK